MLENISIGRYQIIKEIGRGAMSVVYEAKDPDIGRSLAIKLLKHDLVEKDEYKELFLREAKAAGRLSHPGIVTIYDVGIWEERPFIAMELLPGKTLDDHLFEHGTLPLDDAIEFASQMTKALQYAHQSGIVHRDLKPENILVLEDGKRFKITDFGIAHVEHQFLEDEGDKQKTEKIMGTPAYMSPEQITGHGVDAKTDLYSLGVILYQISKGSLPFEAVNYSAMMQAVLQQNPQPLSLVSETGLIWQSIIFRLLQKNPDSRYANALDLFKEVEALQNEVKQNEKGITSIRFVSMKAQWAISLSTVVTLVMILGMIWVYKKQNNLMNQLVFDYGNSLSQIISNETAETLLLGEDDALQAITKDIADNSKIKLISIRDNRGLVKSSTQIEDINKVFDLKENSQLVESSINYKIYSNESGFSEDVFLFDTPISYQEKVIGYANIAVSRSNLNAATRSSLLAMLVWMLLIILAVFTGVYWLANSFTGRINRTRHSLRQMKTSGEADFLKISNHDEMGRLQHEVNELSKKLAGLTHTQQITMTDLETSKEELKCSEQITELDKTVVLSKEDLKPLED